MYIYKSNILNDFFESDMVSMQLRKKNLLTCFWTGSFSPSFMNRMLWYKWRIIKVSPATRTEHRVEFFNHLHF